MRNLIVLLTIACSVLFFRLGSNRLQSWDEAVYAQSAKEMVASGEYLTPHWNQQPFFQKPPLTLWATAALFKLFGVSELTSRAFSALAGVGCVLLTFLIGRLFLSESAALVASLILVVTPHFNYYARQGGMDVPLTFFMLLCLFAYLKAKDDSRWWIVFGLAGGLAVMTKGVAAAPLFVAVGLALVLARSKVWELRHFWIGVGLLIVIGGSWHAVMLQLHGEPFLREYVGQQIMARSSAIVDAEPHTPTYYVTIAFYGLLPFTVLLPLAGVRIYKRREFPIVLLIFGAVVFLMYSVAATKHPWYIVPLYPVLALALASLRYNRAVTALAVLALLHCVILDRAFPVAHPAERDEVTHAQSGAGPFETDINYAPAVLFYSNRKICTADPRHSMAPLTRCSDPDQVPSAVTQ